MVTDKGKGVWLTNPTSIQRPHVKDIDPLHLAHNFQALETGRLLDIRRHGTGLRAWGHEVLFAGDFCSHACTR